MKASDEKLRAGLAEAMRLEDARLEEELQNSEPHVFSEAFEKKMEKLLSAQQWKARRRNMLGRMAAMSAAVVLLVGGVIFIGSEQLGASKLGIDIKEWLAEYFTIENRVERKEEEILFDNSQLGYIPEGFELVVEEDSYVRAYYKYQNADNEFFVIRAFRVDTEMKADNKLASQEAKLNAAGYEYSLTQREIEKYPVIMWIDAENICYTIEGTLEETELVKIMDNIIYMG